MKFYRKELKRPEWCDFDCSWALLKHAEPDDSLHPPKCYKFCPKHQATVPY